MFTKQQLKQQMAEMGLLPTDTVLIHTSMKAIGQVEGGPDGLIDAFCEYLSEGLFLVPTHTWGTVHQGVESPCYDVRTSEPCIGLIPRTAAKRADGIRSLHPTHSVWACGRGAAAFVAGEENGCSPGPVGGCWDRLAEVGAKILLVGVGHERNTFIHSVDERAGLSNRIGSRFELTIRDHGGRELHRTYTAHCCSAGDVSRFYVNFEQPLVRLGAQTSGTLGAAAVKVVDAAACRRIVLRIYSRAAESEFLDYRTIPEEWYL